MANKPLHSLNFGGADTYTIPDPINKTEVMTQPVGVDTDGKLFTKPSSDKDVQAFAGFADGTKIVKVKDIIIQGGTSSESFEQYTTAGGMYVSNTKKFKLEFPIDTNVKTAITGSADKNYGYISNTNVASPVSVSYRLVQPTPFSGAGASSIVRINVQGVHATPPSDPQYSSIVEKRNQAIGIVESYYNAKVNDNREFAYGNNWTYKNSDLVNNENGKALMECDTLVCMMLMGIPYDRSPYADSTPNKTFDFNDIVENPMGYDWCMELKNNPDYGDRVTNTSSMGWLWWNNGMVFTDISQVKTGDIAVFRHESKEYFDNIGHVGVIKMVGNVPYMYHVSTAEYTEGNILDFRPLEDTYVLRNLYRPEDTYFVRPDYS